MKWRMLTIINTILILLVVACLVYVAYETIRISDAFGLNSPAGLVDGLVELAGVLEELEDTFSDVSPMTNYP